MKREKIALLIILSIIIILAFFVLSPIAPPIPMKKNPTSTSNSNYQKLLSIQKKIPTEAGKNLFLRQSKNLTMEVDPELIDLDSQIISCNPEVNGLFSRNPTIGGSCLAGPTTLSTTRGMYLGGQCCGALTNTIEYHERLKKLQAYKNMPDIILDPMHTPIALAKKWIDYDNNTTLTADEQKVYDEAYAISEEKPCCCKCWHYYTNEGIAKKMIKDKTFNAKQIADYWDASEICGT